MICFVLFGLFCFLNFEFARKYVPIFVQKAECLLYFIFQTDLKFKMCFSIYYFITLRKKPPIYHNFLDNSTAFFSFKNQNCTQFT